MHKLLARQLEKSHLTGETSAAVLRLLEFVGETYRACDEEREMAERSMEVCSQEMAARHAETHAAHVELKRLADELEKRVAERTAELSAANAALQADITEREKAEAALRQAEEKYRAIFEGAPEGIFQTTPQGEFLDCNSALAAIYGYESPQALKHSVKDIQDQLYVEPASRDAFIALMQEHDHVSGFEARIYRKDRSIIWISETARAVRDPHGQLLYYEGFVSNITARKQAEEARRVSEERYALAMRGANDGLWDWDLRTGHIYFSARWKEMLGCADITVEPLPESWFARVHADDVNALKSAIASHRENLTSHFEIEHRMLHVDGGYRWMLARGSATRDETGRPTRMAGSLTDITARKEAEQQLIRDALRDGLTGLPNRTLFLDRLERSIALTARNPRHHFAALFIDLDRFKIVNDSLGHAFGDQLLLTVAQRITACVRPSDTVARLGGDEFTILLEEPNAPDDAVNVADRLLATLSKPFQLGPQEVVVTASIGIALSSCGYTRPQDVLRDADTAMYRAKALGKARHQVFDSTMHDRAVKLLQVENDLRRAIDRNEFELHYQPIFSVGSRMMRGFEALIRWRHPELGLIPPSDFIQIAEETGLIVPIGQWVLHEACRQTAAWHAMLPGLNLDINVNLSGKQFSQEDLVEQVVDVLKKTKLPPENLILEITESVVMEDPEATVTMLKRLKMLGVKLNIDDFGTGYSSLAYLQRFPVDTMKIDRSFIARMGQGAENSEIVKTIIALAHNLNMKVTAEGIETQEQLNQLEELECENAQGYLLSRPLLQSAATELLCANAAAQKQLALGA